MKKIIIISLSLMLAGSFAFAQNSEDARQRGVDEAKPPVSNSELIDTVQGTGQGQDTQTQTQTVIEQRTQNQGEEQQVRAEREIQVQIRAGKVFMLEAPGKRAQTMVEAREMIQERQQEMVEELQDLVGAEQRVYQNQNSVRTAVHALLTVEDLVGGIGPQVSQVAIDINDSVLATVVAEEKIQKRNPFVRFFMGGDQEAVEELKQELNKNEERVQELKQLREDCDCDEEVGEMLQEQIQKIEQEQNRLQILTEKETGSRGIFGWVRNLFSWGR